MKKFAIIAAVVVALIGAWIWYINQPDHYYRLGIEVETPDGVKSAANTFAVYQSYTGWGLPEAQGLRQRLKGDAVFLNLGHGKNVVALLAHGPTATDYDRMNSLDNIAFSKAGQQTSWYATKSLVGTAPLAAVDIPTLVTFSDINDLRTAHVVRPDEFEAVFGPGYRFKRAWVEITNGPVSREIEMHLPFLKTQSRELMKSRIITLGEGYMPSMGQFRIGR